ncbi:MAG: methyltransferase domain-containing protein [Bacteroidetes bacterium]|nr:methyltransferase domain-containing protein [Bacteroidota bacterium]
MGQLDLPEVNDNRNYDYSSHPDEDRKEYSIIVDYILSGSTVLDLGCGNGTLLQRLKTEKNVKGTGLEISESGVEICRKRGLDVRYGRIDETLPFKDNEFDYAVCNVTIQMVMYPETLLREMKRVSRYQIISFPNFAFWKNRIELLLKGRMPKRMLFGYSWYSTGHIHQLSINDFHQLLDEVGGMTVESRWVDRSSIAVRNLLNVLFPNLFQLLAVFVLKKNEHSR